MRREMIGFTLVELLVVISIIVVLLALLAPSLDQAVYQAELALCGSNQHAIGTGLISYAVANKSWYPDRPQSGYAFDLRSGPKKDHRPTFRKAMGPLNRLLTCPLASSQPLRYEEARGDASNTFQVINTYNIWFGFTFTEDPTARTMRKLGQRFTYLDESFNALASDRDVVHVQLNEAQSSHPDKTGSMVNIIREDGVLPVQEVYGPAATLYTTAIWWLPGSPRRGPTDDNFLMDDGAVRRVNDIQWDSREDRGLSWVPIQNNAPRSPPNGYMFLPRQ